MPDRASLKAGDRIRIVAVPEGDLRQRKREIREGSELAGWTADTIERILNQDPVVVIGRVDEFGLAWFEYELKREDGTTEYHSLAIMDDESWEKEE